MAPHFFSRDRYQSVPQLLRAPSPTPQTPILSPASSEIEMQLMDDTQFLQRGSEISDEDNLAHYDSDFQFGLDPPVPKCQYEPEDMQWDLSCRYIITILQT
jgi:hypothetical protein